MNKWFSLLLMLLIPLSIHAQDMGALGDAACEGMGPECQENIVTEQDLKNPADKGTMKLISAGASALYMGGVLNGVIKLPAFMGDVAKICAGSGLLLAANVMAFMNARGNGKKIEAELKAIREEAKAMLSQLEAQGKNRSEEFQMLIFDFYMRAMERLQKITELRIKQHGQNSTYYSIAMAVGTAEAIIYSLPWTANPPMAKCGAKSAIFAGIALAMEKKGQSQARKLLDKYIERYNVLANIKGRFVGDTETIATAPGNVDGVDTTSINGGQASGPGRNTIRPGEGELGPIGDLSVTDYGCVNSAMAMDDDCACQATNTCYKTTTTGWGNSRYASAFSNAGLDGYISEMNGAFAGKKADPSTLSLASINEKSASAARLRDRLLKDYADKEKKANKKDRLGDKIGIATDKELADFYNANFNREKLNKMFADNPYVFAGDSVDLGPLTNQVLGDKKAFSEAVTAKGAGADIGGADSAAKALDGFGLGDDKDEQYAAFDPKNILIPEDADYDYMGQGEDIVRNNGASLFDIISHRYQLIYRRKAPEL